ANAVAALGRVYNLRRLQIGQRVTLRLDPMTAGGASNRLISVSLNLRNENVAVAFRDFGDRFSAKRMSAAEAETLLNSIVELAPDDGSGLSARDVVLQRGQSLFRLLIEAGADTSDAYAASEKVGEQINLRRLQIGQAVTVTFETGGEETRLAGVALTLPNGRQTVVGRGVEGSWHHGPAAVVAGDTRAQEAAEQAAAAGESVPEQPLVVGLTERETAPGESEVRSITLRKDEILFNRLVAAGASREEANRAVRELAKVVDMRRLQVGETFRLTFATPQGGGRQQLVGLSAKLRGSDAIVLGWPLMENMAEVAATAPAPAVIHVPPAEETEAVTEAEAVAEAEAVTEAVETEPAVDPADLPPTNHSFSVATIARGDNLSALLADAGAGKGDIVRALIGLRKVHNPNRLRIGQRLVVEIIGTIGEAELVGFTLQSGRRSAVVVEREGESFRATKTDLAALEAAVRTAEAQDRRLANLPPEERQAEEPSGDDLASRVNGHRLVDLNAGGMVTSITIDQGNTLMGTLVDAGVERNEAHKAITAMRELYDPRRLRIGNELAVTFVGTQEQGGLAGQPAAQRRLGALSLDMGGESRLEVVRLEEGGFVSGYVDKDLVRDLRRIEGSIETSLYEAAVEAGLPLSVMMELIRVYSFEVDFQRDIQRGDTFTLMFDMLVDDQGNEVQAGEIYFASMNLSGADTPLYRFELADGRVDYFDAQGRSTRKALMRTPIDGARLSSRFGPRRHPVQGYTKMHQGIDFAAPRGTPIYAAGDGVVERASRYSSYGNYIRIRHNSEYSTAYAHLKSYAKGIYAGKRVVQGQIIGYVGSTGRSTGPHLHYEIFHHGKQVNPLSVKLPTGVRLAGSDLSRFGAERDRLQTQYAELPSIRAVAEGER
ncbi:MAG: peptidoglycan DD-metalloendopeptidase family protein, partial [Alphaproteobacteria bacterium]|nr:peptidoglycan DD-metalloendopeptidase family protein [Alphaproteobacteria bacterium]